MLRGFEHDECGFVPAAYRGMYSAPWAHASLYKYESLFNSAICLHSGLSHTANSSARASKFSLACREKERGESAQAGMVVTWRGACYCLAQISSRGPLGYRGHSLWHKEGIKRTAQA